MFEPVEREYRYGVRPYMLWAAPPLLGLLSGLSTHFALTNREPVLLQGVLEYPAFLANLTAGAAAVFFAVLCVAFLVFAVQALVRPKRLALTATALLVPKGFWSAEERAIPYADMVELTTRTVPDGTQMLWVHYRGGKFAIEENVLPSRAAYQEISGLLAGRVAQGRSPKPVAP